uniref:IPD113_Cow n=1 Tax=Leptochilus wrightii TaxID=187345 RepID=A0AAJ6N666_9MONI|nr:insecticidal protein IPD113 [Leptochilus wrightii]8D2J_A Chain A, IPD113_Cow [Leptochilus wrightii]8D2J_B Chain B, IPD113_Cow [Leptochilus wrightii]8D2J_C Chain C, IPD113_Cow [Leptochilus wrightii]8D2J_D Chain D, IPD113_Cow [Leptochilus wrightii]
MAAEGVETVSELAPATDKVQNADMAEEDPIFTQLAQKMAAAAEKEEVPVDLLAQYMQVEAHDWHNRVRGAILGLISAVPKVGAAISRLIGLFWPANKVDIWEALRAEEYIRNIVQQELFEFEMRLLENDIQALETTVGRYDTAALTEKGNFLSIWISQADALYIRMRNSTNNIHLLLHMVTVSTLHLAALHERLTFGEELYGTNNSTNWTRDLVDKFETYTSDLIPNVFKRWKEWRPTQIEISAWVRRGSCGNLTCRPDVSYATVEDKISGALFSFQATNRNSTTLFLEVCEDHKTRMVNEAIADMASCLSPTFAFHKLLPDDIQTQFSPYDRQQFGQVFRGPYSQDLSHGLWTAFKNFRSRTTRSDQTLRDRILEVIIRAGHHVDAIQFVYDHSNPNLTTPGTVAGNAAGGTRHQVDVRDRPIQELRMEFSQDVLASLQLHFEDGTSTRKFGNELGWATRILTCTAPYGYRFSSWAFREDPGPYRTTAISVLRFQFTPELDMPLPASYMLS